STEVLTNFFATNSSTLATTSTKRKRHHCIVETTLASRSEARFTFLGFSTSGKIKRSFSFQKNFVTKSLRPTFSRISIGPFLRLRNGWEISTTFVHMESTISYVQSGPTVPVRDLPQPAGNWPHSRKTSYRAYPITTALSIQMR